MARVSIFLIRLVLIGGTIGCAPTASEQYDLTISSTQGGSVTIPGEGTFTYDEGEVVDLVAEPDEGYHFVNWTGDVGTVANISSASSTITMDDDCSIAANFARGPAIPLKNPGSFVQMTIGEPETLDPAAAYDTSSGEQILYAYEPLLFYKGESIVEFEPLLAESWTWNEADLTWTFKIRKGVKFHEGGDLTPEDVEYSFERIMTQDRLGGPALLIDNPLLGVEAYEETTFAAVDAAVEVSGDNVVFKLSDAGFKTIFLQTAANSWGAILDKEWCVANGDWDGTEADVVNHYQVEPNYLWTHMNGTGPWKLNQWEKGVQIKLQKFDGYWQDPAPFDWVITQLVEEWTTRKEAFLAGDADHLAYVPREYIGELEGVADLNVYQDLPELIVSGFLFNMDIASNSSYIGSGALDGNGIPSNFFTDIDVRKGFCYAFDYETYIEDGWLGQAQQLGSPVCEGLPYFNPDAPMYSLDLAKAEDHLKVAWGGQVWEKGFKFTLLYNLGSLWRETACKILAENLAKINARFEVSIQPMKWTGILPGLKSGLVPMFTAAWMGDYPHPNPFVVPFMASYGFWADFQRYGYPELDQLIERAFKELDPAVQRDIYCEVQERYYEDAPGIMLVQPLGRRYFTKYIHGFYFNPMIPGQAGPLYYMSKSSS